MAKGDRLYIDKEGHTMAFFTSRECDSMNEVIASYGLLWAKERIFAECEGIAKRYTCPFNAYSIAHGVCAAIANREAAINGGKKEC